MRYSDIPGEKRIRLLVSHYHMTTMVKENARNICTLKRGQTSSHVASRKQCHDPRGHLKVGSESSEVNPVIVPEPTIAEPALQDEKQIVLT
ncbi:hypothetical protein AGR1A_Lc30014 [Agrobacterium fabacearum CFBP 5771]|nr:hypothetical protein AGR1A_Lc30014 [Agrobacterium fabacearum CFBP 5771]